jgi:hypothetical protein
MAGVLYNAAKDGDAKAALDILKHTHGWVAKQAVQVEVNQTISVRHALEEAQRRVIEGVAEAATTLTEDAKPYPERIRADHTV